MSTKNTLTPTAKLTSEWIKEQMFNHRVRGVEVADKMTEAGKPTTPSYVSNVRRVGMSLQKANEIADVMGWEPPMKVMLKEEVNKHPDLTDTETHIVISSLTPRAGCNEANNDYEILDKIQVSKYWLHATYPHINNLHTLALCSIKGDSMEPTFNEDDTILVDRSTLSFDSDGVYVFTYHDTLLIKRIQRRPGHGYMVISDNRDLYETYLISNEDLANVSVHGRVIGKFGFDRI